MYKALELNQVFKKYGYDSYGKEGPLFNDLNELLCTAEDEMVKKCIEKLGGRYGAAATKDLRTLLNKE